MWLPIDDVYSVSIDGQIKRYGKLMKGASDKLGYRHVSHYNRLVMLHLLIAYRFLPSPTSESCQIDHIDRNKSNNHASNLRWCSRSVNMINRTFIPSAATGQQNITLNKNGRYVFKIKRNKIITQKIFKTLSEAIEARDNFFLLNN